MSRKGTVVNKSADASPILAARSRVLDFFNTLLSPQEWVYLSTLILPFAICSIALKLIVVFASLEIRNVNEVWDKSDVIKSELGRILILMCPEVAFSLGYALLWIGLFSAVHGGPLRRAIVFFFHATTVLAGLAIVCASGYFRQMGTTLDYKTISTWLPQFEEVKPIIMDALPPWVWVLLAAVFLYAIVGPPLMVYAVGRYRGWPREDKAVRTNLSFRSLVLCALALGFGMLSWLSAEPIRAWILIPTHKSIAYPPLVNMIKTTWQQEGMKSQEQADIANSDLTVAANAPTEASLVPTGSERRNVVIVYLESTRAQSTTPYNEDIQSTPFLDELAKSSLVADQAYAPFPWSSKANVATLCGIYPHMNDPYIGTITESKPDNIPSRCIADLLKDQGYRTGYFFPTDGAWDNWSTLVENMGYDDFYPIQSLDKEGFEEVNYLGSGKSYEEDILLEPTEKWLESNKDQPFLATYHTTSAHYPYKCSDRYGEQSFAEDEELNRYLNCVHYQDTFLKNLFDLYKKLGLYEDTVFVILGDHGEGFGEHAPKSHGVGLYEEALRIPMIFHDPRQFKNGAHITDPVSQIDVLPTIAEMLGYKIQGGVYQGSSLLHPITKDDPLIFGCVYSACMGSLKGSEKFIHNYAEQTDELYDLSNDPLERNNLVDEYSEEEIKERRTELLVWRSKIDDIYKINNP